MKALTQRLQLLLESLHDESRKVEHLCGSVPGNVDVFDSVAVSFLGLDVGINGAQQRAGRGTSRHSDPAGFLVESKVRAWS